MDTFTLKEKIHAEIEYSFLITPMFNTSYTLSNTIILLCGL